MPSGYLNGQSAAFFNGKNVGERIGQQQVMDATMIYLHRHGWGEKRIKEYFIGMNAILDEYAEAFMATDNQPIIQERMDAELSEVIPHCLTFLEQYPEIKAKGFDKAVKEQRHPAAKKRGKRK